MWAKEQLNNLQERLLSDDVPEIPVDAPEGTGGVQSDGSDRLAVLLDDAVDEEETEKMLAQLDNDAEGPPGAIKAAKAKRIWKPIALSASLLLFLILMVVPFWKTDPAAKRGLALFMFAAACYGSEALPACALPLRHAYAELSH